MPHRTFLAAALVLATVACEAPPEPTARTAARPAEDRGVAAQGIQGPAHQRAPGKPGRPAVAPEAAPRLTPQQVTWPAATSADTEVRARFDETARRRIDTADLPVLAPRDARVYAEATVVTKPSWFTVSLKDAPYAAEMVARRENRAVPVEGGVSVFVQGNRVAHHHPAVPPAVGRHTVRGKPAWITQNESIWSVTWAENGVTYVVELECSRPSDPRCANETALVEVVESLVFVGGAGPVNASKGAGR